MPEFCTAPQLHSSDDLTEGLDLASCLAAEFAVATVLNAVESARPVAASRISWFGWRSCESRSSTRRRRRT